MLRKWWNSIKEFLLGSEVERSIKKELSKRELKMLGNEQKHGPENCTQRPIRKCEGYFSRVEPGARVYVPKACRSCSHAHMWGT